MKRIPVGDAVERKARKMIDDEKREKAVLNQQIDQLASSIARWSVERGLKMYSLWALFFFSSPRLPLCTWFILGEKKCHVVLQEENRGKYNLACVASVSALLSTQAINNRNALDFASFCFNNKYMTSCPYTEPLNLRNMYTTRLKLLQSSFFQSVLKVCVLAYRVPPSRKKNPWFSERWFIQCVNFYKRRFSAGR